MSAQTNALIHDRWELIRVTEEPSKTISERNAEKRQAGALDSAHFACVLAEKGGLEHQMHAIVFTGTTNRKTLFIRKSDFYVPHKGELIGGAFDRTGNLYLYRSVHINEEFNLERFIRERPIISRHIIHENFIKAFKVITELRTRIGIDFFLDSPGSVHPGIVTIEGIDVKNNETFIRLRNQSSTAKAELTLNLDAFSLTKVFRIEIPQEKNK